MTDITFSTATTVITFTPGVLVRWDEILGKPTFGTAADRDDEYFAPAAHVHDQIGAADEPKLAVNEGVVTLGGQPVPATQIGLTAGESVYDRLSGLGSFASRPIAVAIANALPWPVGAVISDGTVEYRYAGAPVVGLADMPGWVPKGDVTPDHFAANATPGTTDMTAAIQAAADYSQCIRLRATIYRISDTITFNQYAPQIIGAGRGSSGVTASSLYNKSATRIVWYGSGTKHMFAYNPGTHEPIVGEPGYDPGAPAHPNKWGGRFEGFALYGRGVTGVSGFDIGPKTPNASYREIEIHGVVNGFDMGRNAYAVTFDHCSVYAYSGYGWYGVGDNHNTRWLACQMHYCNATSPLGGIYMRGVDGGASTGLSFIGCDFEPYNAPSFLRLESASGVTITGCYFEARSANTQQFIRLGENGVGLVMGASITGCEFGGANYAREVVMMQNASSGVVVEGNHIWGITGSIINNASPGTRNRLGQNWVSSTPANFVGGRNGWTGETRTRLTADTAAITVSTDVLDHTHYLRDRMRTRRITARLNVQIEDATATNVSSIFSIQKYDGTTWSTLGAFARAQVFANTGTRAITSQTIVMDEVDTSASTLARYRVLVAPGTGDSVVVMAGSSIAVIEGEA